MLPHKRFPLFIIPLLSGDLHFYCRAIPAAASCLTGLYVKTDLDSPMPDVPINTRNKIDTGDTKCPGTSCPFKNDRRDEVYAVPWVFFLF